MILSLYQQDPANYFILLPQRTIATLTERLTEKPIENMQRFFRIVEWVGLNLGYVLGEELQPIIGSVLKNSVKILNVLYIFILEWHEIGRASAFLSRDCSTDLGNPNCLATFSPTFISNLENDSILSIENVQFIN